MSTQSINKTDQNTYQKKFDKNLRVFSEKWWYKEKFLIGYAPTDDEIRHTMLFHRLLCTNSCEMSEFIFDRINDRLDEKCEKKSKLSKILDCYKKEHNCSEKEVIENCCTIKTNW